MSKELIKLKIKELLSERNSILLPKFLDEPEFKDLATGNQTWYLLTKKGEESNIQILANVSVDCIDAFNELRHSQEIAIGPTTEFFSAIEGYTNRLPIATKIQVYKTPHWMPSLVVKGKHF
ncbi:hypothetical protein [Siphonobacter curvatus]|nr:hypothetical protein [Siphonobacter curvatus]